jgi:hypothetical protein
MNSKKYEILKMKDNFNSLKIQIPLIFDVPSRLLIVGKSELSGKSNLIANLLLRDKFYKSYYKPENIFIICKSSNLDQKWRTIIQELDIEKMNIMNNFNENKLEALYEVIKEEYEQNIEAKKKPEHYLFIFDDMSYGGDLKASNNGIISKLFCNGRHILISTWVTAQKYSQIPTTARENATGLILFNCTNKQLELIYEDHGTINRNHFFKLFHEITSVPYSFLVINYSNSKEERFLNNQFEVIDIEKYKN